MRRIAITCRPVGTRLTALHTLLFGVLVGTLAAGCGHPLPPTRHYRLWPPPTPPTAAGGSEEVPRCEDGRLPSLAVEELEVDAAYDDVRIVYRQTPYQLEHYDYHLWGAAPGVLVSDALRSGYAAVGRFDRVQRGWDAHAGAIVRGRLLALEEVDHTPTRWFAHVELELELVDARTEQRLWSQRYDASEPMPERSPAGLARATSVVLAQIVDRSAPSIAAQLLAQPGTCAPPRAPAEPSSG